MKNIFSGFMGILVLLGTVSCQSGQQPTTADKEMTTPTETVVMEAKYDPPQDGKIEAVRYSSAEWKEILSDQEFYVLREAGTERAFTGDLLKNKEEGVYTCAGCGLPLFASDTKFESGTGWPSYWKPLDERYILEKADNKYGMRRVEVLCSRCEGHLGHVFEDGPAPTGLRYCINSVSLDFVPKAMVKKP